MLIKSAMQLSDWLQSRELTQEAFARIVGVTQGRIAQILQGDMPSMGLAARIHDATGGAVAPNDFAKIATPSHASLQVSAASPTFHVETQSDQ